MTYQISLSQLRQSIAAYQVSKRNVGDVFSVKDALHRYFIEHAPLFDVVDGQLTVNPEMRLYIAWKDSKPVFYWCFNADAETVEMMLRNEFTEYGDMSHHDVTSWLDVMERNEINQANASTAVDATVVTPILGGDCECHMLPTGFVWYPVKPSDSVIHADDHVTFSYVSSTVLVAYGDYKTIVPLNEYNREKFLEKLSTMTVLKHLGSLIRNRLG